MKRTWIAAAAGFYFLGSIVTFGHAAVFFEQRGQANFEACVASLGIDHMCGLQKATGAAALVSAVAWPFYVSYQIARRI